MKTGLFLGLATLDLVYLASKPPGENQKVVAVDSTIAAGGPATNAAVAFSGLGNAAVLAGVLGTHAIAQLIRADLAEYNVRIIDLQPGRSHSPPVSSIIVTQQTGDRAVISVNATKSQVDSQAINPDILTSVNIILFDGHQIPVSQEIAQLAQSKNIPIVLDGGSWKPGLEKILPCVEWVVCSENFHPPDCHNSQQIFAYLSAAGIPNIAITRGEKPIQYFSNGCFGSLEVPQIQAADTLGGGDIFHGAFCHYILQKNFTNALTAAAKVASHSCKYFGTRQWIKNLQP
ncbi:MAG: sugar kinase [Microcoleus sp. PH2017_10_PVI_O_A]|uniref:sugar kinase n=1 Tax=unclassified Microcoleus TaxID=2642155 RepID=UPI001DEED348|nr:MULTISPECIES: sugar kinase [unclassified Microcoleus]TAE84333.1 MAG: sugar kinase [Oscillatoriales cyanobacterium]MCC3405488.1 sugar kinase [Microcoleus sp. PH2017_10_PVI_O_A]MCC3461693.1 sugar kinase [Microcoleus sp. PH2017_11_PCY_U_A]MCC3477590.1 sugar kinase [Microcoleus sp. PH2017_12_PCY_D_A]MCC3528991.1 sugar kinase [Microcoleus sp. PH2017_21_RUC_O_A]